MSAKPTEVTCGHCLSPIAPGTIFTTICYTGKMWHSECVKKVEPKRYEVRDGYGRLYVASASLSLAKDSAQNLSESCAGETYKVRDAIEERYLAAWGPSGPEPRMRYAVHVAATKWEGVQTYHIESRFMSQAEVQNRVWSLKDKGIKGYVYDNDTKEYVIELPPWHPSVLKTSDRTRQELERAKQEEDQAIQRRIALEHRLAKETREEREREQVERAQDWLYDLLKNGAVASYSSHVPARSDFGRCEEFKVVLPNGAYAIVKVTNCGGNPTKRGQ